MDLKKYKGGKVESMIEDILELLAEFEANM